MADEKPTIETTFVHQTLTGIIGPVMDDVRARLRIEVEVPAQAVANSIMQAIGKECRKQGLVGFWGADHESWRKTVYAEVVNTMVNDALRRIAGEITPNG